MWAEKARSHFPKVDNFIAAVKTETMKNKHRRYQFDEIGTPLRPGLISSGTRPNATECYTKNLMKVRDVVNSFEGDGIIKRAVAAGNDRKLRECLVKTYPPVL